MAHGFTNIYLIRVLKLDCLHNFGKQHVKLGLSEEVLHSLTIRFVLSCENINFNVYATFYISNSVSVGRIRMASRGNRPNQAAGYLIELLLIEAD